MKKYTDSTLMSFTKKDLVEIIKCLYYNNEALEKQNEQQLGCNLHKDEKHQEIAESCGYCEDFHCFRAEKGD